jgi:hypothetical protein
LESRGEAFDIPALGQWCGALTVFLKALERRCPDHVEAARWQQAVDDGHLFLVRWGDQAAALGWAVGDLFGLHEPPERPSLLYRRLSRHDCTGLVWFLRGREVIALTADAAVIATSNGGRLSFYKSAFPAEVRARA